MEDEDIMPTLRSITSKQENAIQEFERRMKNSLTPSLREDPVLFYRFLKARDFDVDKAEKMLQKHIVWRKIHQVDTILEDFTPRKFFTQYPEPSLIGFDKEGNMVRYAHTGKFSPFEIIRATKMCDFMKHWYWFGEKSLALMKAENERTGKNAYQVAMIFDLDMLTFKNATSKIASDIFLHFINEYQDNYPERMKASYVINAPSFFVFVFTILKTVMSSAMLRKIFVFGRSGWKEKLLEDIDPDVLPAFLGGNRTDPDGNPLCHTFIHHEGKIPECFFMTDEERYFRDKSRVQTMTIEAGEKREIHKTVKEVGTRLEWEFLLETKDIGFGVFLEESENNLKEIIPIKKYCTPDGSASDFCKCREIGKYIFIFDNSYSWRSYKEVQYCITIVSPEL